MSNALTEVTVLPGVGEERADALAQMGIEKVRDLLNYFPYKYENLNTVDLNDAKHEDKITVVGTVQSQPAVRFFGRKKSRMTVRVLVQERYLLQVILFNRHFAQKQFQIGKEVRLSGKLDKHRMQLIADSYSFQTADIQKSNQTSAYIPVYSLKQDFGQAFFRKLISAALAKYTHEIEENLPEHLMQRYKLISKREAVMLLHQPQHSEHVQAAIRRMKYEELFLFQLKVHSLRYLQREQLSGQSLSYDRERINLFAQQLPFQLTDDQQHVLEDVLRDMQSPYAMNRLLQGDVGSGKTVVAALALYAAYTAGMQGALMVPTEILAEQHFQSLTSLFKDTPVQLALLTGSSKTKERKEILAGLQLGTIDIVIGTHALIQDSVHFRQLGLVVIDEQHRFGVEQRRKLRQKGVSPDLLFMTATPIPRTLAITAFGDMDVSTIKQLPAGRKVIETYWIRQDMFSRVLQFIDKQCGLGRQAYFVCPLIEESEKLDVQNVIDTHAMLQQALPKLKIGLLYGRMHADEKDQVMQAFAHNALQVLVTTTVVEVGVNVPNATLMIIQDADRFGLSQLHQLRGRVGRGEHQSYCILIADPKTEIGMERMQIMRETSDGFELAQRDLELRGPGDYFGTKQSGLPHFQFADLVHDYRILEVARDDAAQLVQHPQFWTDRRSPLYHYLEQEGILKTYQFD